MKSTTSVMKISLIDINVLIKYSTKLEAEWGRRNFKVLFFPCEDVRGFVVFHVRKW